MTTVCLFDIDGTLIGKSGEISERTIRAIAELKERGVKVALASGRPAFAARRYAEILSVNDVSMFFSGSFIENPSTGEVFEAMELSADDLKALTVFAEEKDCQLEFYTAQGFYVRQRNELLDIHISYLEHEPLGVLAELPGGSQVVKVGLMFRSSAHELKAIEDLRASFPDLTILVSYGAADPDIAFVNITHKKATRENAFAMLNQAHGVRPEQVICFGDAEADKPFISLAGMGVAMANAPESVRAVADRVAPDVEEDGVAVVLAEVFDLTL